MSPELMLLPAFVIGYLCGSILFGLILTKLAGTGDILRHRLRQHRRDQRAAHRPQGLLAAATLIGDMLKGTVAVTIAGLALGGSQAAMIAALGAFLGHLFPIWLKFKGGKGVATYIGVLLGLFWPAAIRILHRLARNRLRVPLLVAVGAGGERGDADLAVVVRLLSDGRAVPGAHRTALRTCIGPNIQRLMNGTEGRIGAKG